MLYLKQIYLIEKYAYNNISFKIERKRKKDIE